MTSELVIHEIRLPSGVMFTSPQFPEAWRQFVRHCRGRPAGRAAGRPLRGGCEMPGTSEYFTCLSWRHYWKDRGMGEVVRKLAADVINGLDGGLTEVLWMLGFTRTSRAEREAAAALLERR